MRLPNTARWLAVLGCLAALGAAGIFATRPAAGAAPPRPPPLPEGIKVTLVTERTQYFLGENILLQYRITNTGAGPFKISVGGDYRGSTRADRFMVTAATSPGGQPVPDPTPGMKNWGGGLGGTPE